MIRGLCFNYSRRRGESPQRPLTFWPGAHASGFFVSAPGVGSALSSLATTIMVPLMGEQNSETHKERVFNAVVEAVMEASRVPGSTESHMNVNDALEGMCEAMASIVAAVAVFPEGREQAAVMIETASEEIADRLRVFAEKTRSGEWRMPPGPPKLRVVD